MALKKGQKIWSIYIDHGKVTAFTKDMEPISITRSQRNALADFKNPKYLEIIQKEFSHKEPLHEEFSVMKDGILVYQLQLVK